MPATIKQPQGRDERDEPDEDSELESAKLDASRTDLKQVQHLDSCDPGTAATLEELHRPNAQPQFVRQLCGGMSFDHTSGLWPIFDSQLIMICTLGGEPLSDFADNRESSSFKYTMVREPTVQESSTESN